MNYTLPIYEAVVSNLALEKMRQEEEQERLLSGLLQNLSLSKELLKLLGEADFSNISLEAIQQTYIALCLLVDSARQAISGIYTSVESIHEKYRAVLTNALGDMEANVEQFEEICEAWGMALDKSAVSDIKKALCALKKSGNKEIPNWRDALAKM